MTPKDKAIELYNKYWILTPQPFIERVEYYNESKLIFNDWDKDWTNKYAKQCALIAVDEIILSRKDDSQFDDTLWAGGSDMYRMHPMYLNYWQEVKQEIENL
jgi:hypothetical protein